ncbi:MAG: hypothetical protein GIX03_16420 [Candidatus Eremiobacteraeota bacterium]|nr:hypothetical protein [Candidatus Eremiobacteraeota bacterium]
MLRTFLQPASNRDVLAAYVLGALFQFIRIVFVVVAALIVFRRPQRADARALAAFLISTIFVVARWPWYSATLAGVLDILRSATVVYGLMQALRFATIFPAPSTRGIRRLFEHANPYATAVALAIAVYAPLTTIALDVAWSQVTNIVSALSIVLIIYVVAGLASGFLTGAREALPADRQRLRWIAFSIGIGLGGLFVAVALQQLGASEFLKAPFVLIIAAIPLGTGYAILRHRMLDIGFVVNRALVFGIISALVVAAFSLLEFLLGKYFTSLGHVQSALLEAVLALGIGISLSRIHQRVDHAVDTVFFRERHRAEAALRRLAHEAPNISDPSVLAQRLVAGVSRHAAVRNAALYLQGEGRDYALRLSSAEAAAISLEHDDLSSSGCARLPNRSIWKISQRRRRPVR